MSKIPFLDLKAINARHRDELVAAATRVIDSGWYVLGSEVEAFEKEFTEWTRVRETIGVSNGLMALRLVLEAWIEQGKLRRGDKVVVPANTFIASILAITGAGLTPVFVDPDEQTYNISASGLEGAITPSVKAVMAVHLYGRIAPMDELLPICEEHGLPLIEDSAQAHGAEINGRKAGAWGDAAAFSFYPGKNMGALGDAGATTCNDPDTAKIVRSLANYGSSKKYEHVYRGGNDRLDEMQAAMLRVKLRHMDEDHARRRDIASQYNTGISHPSVNLPALPCDPRHHAWHLYVIRVEKRDAFLIHMQEQGVQCLIHYPAPSHLQKAYRSEFGHLSLPLTEKLSREVVSLPISPAMDDAEVRTVIDAVNLWSS